MTKTPKTNIRMKAKNYGFFGGSEGAGGVGVGVLGVKAFSGVCCVPFMARKSPAATLLMPMIGAFDCVCCVADAEVNLCSGVWPLKFSLNCCLVATKGRVGECCVLVMRTTGALPEGVEAGLFEGVFI